MLLVGVLVPSTYQCPDQRKWTPLCDEFDAYVSSATPTPRPCGGGCYCRLTRPELGTRKVRSYPLGWAVFAVHIPSNSRCCPYRRLPLKKGAEYGSEQRNHPIRERGRKWTSSIATSGYDLPTYRSCPRSSDDRCRAAARPDRPRARFTRAGAGTGRTPQTSASLGPTWYDDEPGRRIQFLAGIRRTVVSLGQHGDHGPPTTRVATKRTAIAVRPATQFVLRRFRCPSAPNIRR